MLRFQSLVWWIRGFKTQPFPPSDSVFRFQSLVWWIRGFKKLEGGIDGTVGKTGELRYNDTTLYVSVGASTTAVSNWKKITFDV